MKRGTIRKTGQMPKLIVIAGPTASGKTALAIEVAKAFDAEILSADSRQFYRHLDIGTAKPTAQEQHTVRHHFIDILEPHETYSAGAYESDVLTLLQGYFQHKDVAVITGGSGLYLNAVIHGFDDLPASTPATRQKWQEFYNREGLGGLQEALRTADPEYARQVDMNNPQRMLRALEAIDTSGLPFSALRKQHMAQRDFGVEQLLLWPPRDLLYQRINQRVDNMIAAGLVEEAHSLEKFRKYNALQTVGYTELFAYFDGKMTLDEAVSKIKQHTRNYAKRQYTWFGSQNGYVKFESAEPSLVIKHLKQKNLV